MQFNIPTSLEEMYVVLNDLYYYYRIRREAYEDVMLKPLKLERLDYTSKTDQQLIEETEVLLSSQHEREKSEYVSKIKGEITQLENKLALIESSKQEQIQSVNKTFEESIKKVESQAIKAGLINSNVVVVQTAKLESDKNSKLAQINYKTSLEIADINSQISVLRTQLENANDYFAIAHAGDKEKKLLELKEKRFELDKEVFKYNNSLDEKEQNSENRIKQIQMSLKIQYLEVTTGEFTKDQLVDMGYYADVIDCVCGYFDTLAPLDAYYAFKGEKKLVIYLDDYYESVLYGYRVNSGL